MSYALMDLQSLAEDKGREYFSEKHYNCLPSVLLALGYALRDVDGVNYSDPVVVRATCALPMGFGVWDGPCGAVTAGTIAIGLKYGTADAGDQLHIDEALMRSARWVNWFRYRQFGSCNCSEIKATPLDMERCTEFVVVSIRKLVEMLTEGDPKVTR